MERCDLQCSAAEGGPSPKGEPSKSAMPPGVLMQAVEPMEAGSDHDGEGEVPQARAPQNGQGRTRKPRRASLVLAANAETMEVSTAWT